MSDGQNRSDGSVVTPEQQALIDSVSIPLMVLDRKQRFVYANDSYLAATHSELSELLGRDVFDCFPETEERVAAVRAIFARTLSEGVTTQLDKQPFELEHEDGTVRELVWQATQDPLFDTKGRVVGLIQRAEDITAQHELEKQNEAIKHELQHRVKNIMAVVTSIARITGRNATSVPEFVTNFVDRLRSVARSNLMLAEDSWRGLTVRKILEGELQVYLDEDASAHTINGPRVRLSLQATKDLCMVIHELATNAAKYGCLGEKGGSLLVSWTFKDKILTLTWVERCDVPISAPSGKTGFGTRLLDMLPYIEAERDFQADGLHMTITVTGDTAFS